ncbi:MAG: GNAT family N-acetyltransferase [Gammaproteobacteria bacterium]
MHYQIRLASFNEIKLMLEWAAVEQWNPGLNDAIAFQLIDLKGFFIGYLGDEPIACISLVKYNTEFGFLGLYLVKPAYRGKGYGYQIWQHAMKYAGQCNIGLDGVTAQQSNYQKSGFKLAHKNLRYLLPSHSVRIDLPSTIKLAATLPFDEIALYDRFCFPCKRDAFLASWLVMNNATSLVYFDKVIKGYGVIRACQQGFKIGPLFADNRQIASVLFQALCNSVEAKDQNIYLDIPEKNLEAVSLVHEFGMQPVFETARMYTKEFPAIAIDKIFSITSFEMG